MAYIQGESRSQTSLFAVSLEELIPEDHLVRVIDLYVAKLDLVQLGFDKALPKSTGRPSYDPADQLKLYLCGYFQRIRSSRRLEAECQRNIEVMWLINRLKPDFKTIADFRKNNQPAFVATCRAFVQFCRSAGLIAGSLVAIDDSKFQAFASSRRHMNLKQLKHQEEKLDKHIAQYLAELDEAGISVYVPPNRSLNPGGEELFGHKDLPTKPNAIVISARRVSGSPSNSATRAIGSIRRLSATALPARSNPNARVPSAAMSHAMPMRKPLSEWSNGCGPVHR